jgi:hypothetical protein
MALLQAETRRDDVGNTVVFRWADFVTIQSNNKHNWISSPKKLHLFRNIKF